MLTWIKISRPYSDFEDPTRILADALMEFGLDNKRLGYDRDAYFFRAFEQEGFIVSIAELLDVAEAQVESGIQPNSALDDRRWEVEISIADRIHPASLTAR